MSNAWAVASTCRHLRLRPQCLPQWGSAARFTVRALSTLACGLGHSSPAVDTRQAYIPSLLHRSAVRPFSLSAGFQKSKGRKGPKSPPTPPQPPRKTAPKAATPKAARPVPNGDTPSNAGILPNGPTDAEVSSLFDNSVTAAEGHEILRTLQTRRTTGSLAEEGIALSNAPRGVNDAILMKALEYLRQKYPIDEGAAAAEWAEVQAEKLEKELTARGQRLGIYKKTEGVVEEEEEEQTQEALYGRSVLETKRRRNEAAYERELKEKEAQKAKQQETLGLQSRGKEVAPLKSWAELRANTAKSEWVKYYEEKAQVVKGNKLPKLSYTQRVLPSFLFLTVLLGALYIYTTMYAPPPRHLRLFPDQPPALTTAIALVALNTIILCFWRFPPLWRTLNSYFLLVPAYPRAAALIGANFSHVTLSHLLGNMAVLVLAGVPLHDQIGRANFLALYLGAGAVANFVSLAISAGTPAGLVSSTLGASGGVMALVAAALVVKEDASFTVPGLEWRIPGANWALLAFLFVTQVRFMRMADVAEHGFNNVVHLGGLVCGTAAGVGLRWARGLWWGTGEEGSVRREGEVGEVKGESEEEKGEDGDGEGKKRWYEPLVGKLTNE